MTDFNKLPVVITGPGEYVARNGARVIIERIGGGVSATFDAKGYYYPITLTKSGAPARSKYRSWHKSGRYFVLDECPRDVVAAAPKVKGGL